MTAPASPRDRVLQRLELVCEELGPALISEVTLVGGSLQAVLPLEVPNRPTKDVDFILPTPTASSWHRFLRAMEDRGFKASSDEDAPVCRYEKSVSAMKLVVDVMPTDGRLGFSNRWYTDAHAHRQETSIPGLFGATPLHYLLTKIEAYTDRGARDPLSSHDLEDIITLCRGLPALLDEVQAGSSPAHVAARTFLRSLASRRDSRALIEAHTEGTSSAQHGAAALLIRLSALP